MKNKFSIAMSLAVIMSMLLTSLALADVVQNDVGTVGDVKLLTITAGATGATVYYDIQATGGDATDAKGNNCNAADGSAAKVTPEGMPSGVTTNPTFVTFTNCTSSSGIIFTAASSTTPGDYPITVSVNDTGASDKDYNTQPAAFTLRVLAASTPTPSQTPPPTDTPTPPPADTPTPTPTPDTTAPVISYTVNGVYPEAPDGNNNWYKSDVALVWTVTDPESPVSKIGCVDQNITVDQNATTYSCSASSAGGTAAQVDVTIKRDATAPTLSFGAQSPAANANGWNNTNVSFPFITNDNLSGVDTTNPASSPLVLMVEGFSVTGTVVVSDNAGNSANFTSPAVKIDKTAPNAPAASASTSDGPYTADTWTNKDVTVSYASNGDAGLVQSGGVSCTANQVFSAETADTNTSGTCTDAAGNTSIATSFGPIKIDKTAPTLSPNVLPIPVLLNGSATASANASDTLSGLVSSACDAVVTNTVGTFNVNCTATDKAGNTATASVSYTVSFKICALYDQSKSHKAGSTVPVKLQLCDAYGVNYSSISNVLQAKSVSKVDNSALGILDDSGAANAPDMNFRYDSTLGGSGGYIFNLSTKGLTTGTWKLTFTVNGQPTTYFVQFDIK